MRTEASRLRARLSVIDSAQRFTQEKGVDVFLGDARFTGADSVEVATPMLDRAVELYEKFMDMGLGEKDGAAMVDVIGALPRTEPDQEDLA